jgi:hypothetical protein
VIKVHEGISWPEPEPQLFARDYLTGLLEQHGEDLEGLPMQLDPQSVLSQFAGPKVYFEGAKTENPV